MMLQKSMGILRRSESSWCPIIASILASKKLKTAWVAYKNKHWRKHNREEILCWNWPEKENTRHTDTISFTNKHVYNSSLTSLKTFDQKHREIIPQTSAFCSYASNITKKGRHEGVVSSSSSACIQYKSIIYYFTHTNIGFFLLYLCE